MVYLSTIKNSLTVFQSSIQAQLQLSAEEHTANIKFEAVRLQLGRQSFMWSKRAREKIKMCAMIRFVFVIVNTQPSHYN